ncbi:RNA polymerase factor sigma-54 [Rhodobacter ferrooxidans]|uniref:RNA polymerase sigma-54 factor n=1 Tax=Rhodobacter ferrooxidans TaxID=371731 RepID=C8S196_9RHOB|nr:RNA polymerase factor sigma-54 [Rhodobacter sp. SW2]EEW25294.1 RNA polymerase, sigma 54 subunit, RpoN [Rhodobacter sp. SW2]
MKTRPRIVLAQTQRLQLNLGLSASIQLLQADASGLTRYLQEQAADNPHLSLQRPAPGDWLPRWTTAFAQTAQPPEAASAAPSLMAHVMDRIEALTRPGRERQIAHLLAEALEPSGWVGRSLEAIADSAGASLPEAEAVLAKLQKGIEPVGLFARNLAECLRLQAQDADCLDPVMQAVLGHLDLLADGQFSRLARLCGVTEAEITARLRLIRGFDPKPGAQFDHGAAPLREPDLLATRGPTGWQVALNRSALPMLELHAPDHRPVPEAAKAQWAAAQALNRMLQNRNATLLRVAAEVLRRQEAALERGLSALVPLTMAQVAEALGLHESTISRIVAGTAVDTPLGCWWLRQMFSTRLGNETDGVSAAALRAALARLVAGEDPGKPLGDQALVEALAQDGMVVARRTVAKYREMLHIPPAHRRRRAKVPAKRSEKAAKGRAGG